VLGSLPRFASVFVALVLAAPALAADPAPEEVLPPPQPAFPPPVTMLPPPPPLELMLFPRQDHYAVWQYSSPDRTGRQRPRVIATAEGAWYYANGVPFPWYTTHPGEFRPIIANPATFYQP
jgi:hypothetical protein